MTTAERVIRESNLIARNFECWGERSAVSATADHINRFWAPYLKAVLFKEARANPERFSSIAREAVSTLERPVTPPALTAPATPKSFGQAAVREPLDHRRPPWPFEKY